MWPGTKARLKGRANMINQLTRPQETDRHGRGPAAPLRWAPALRATISTNYTVRGSSLYLDIAVTVIAPWCVEITELGFFCFSAASNVLLF